MPGRVALEDFDATPTGGELDLDGAGMPPRHTPEAEPKPLPEPEPVPDPEAARRTNLARIAAAVEAVAAEQAGLRGHFIARAAEALGAAAEALLPALARGGFAALVAETVRVVAAGAEWPELTISLASAEAEELVRFLDESGSAPRIRIEARPSAAPGEAEIAWENGGARIDAGQITETVLANYRQKLESLAQAGA